MTWLTQLFMPHRHCFNGDTVILVNYLIGDGLTGVAYTTIATAGFRVNS